MLHMLGRHFLPSSQEQGCPLSPHCHHPALFLSCFLLINKLRRQQMPGHLRAGPLGDTGDSVPVTTAMKFFLFCFFLAPVIEFTT